MLRNNHTTWQPTGPAMPDKIKYLPKATDGSNTISCCCVLAPGLNFFRQTLQAMNWWNKGFYCRWCLASVKPLSLQPVNLTIASHGSYHDFQIIIYIMWCLRAAFPGPYVMSNIPYTRRALQSVWPQSFPWVTVLFFKANDTVFST